MPETKIVRIPTDVRAERALQDHRASPSWPGVDEEGAQRPGGAVTIELDDAPVPTSHRLSELVQALSGCSVEAAELALGDPTPDGPVPAERALDAVAEALVRLRRFGRGQRAAPSEH